MSGEQLNLEYLNKKNLNTFWSHISRKLAPITKGINFQEWAEHVSADLYSTHHGKDTHVDPIKYFAAVKVGSFRYSRNISVHAKLINHHKEFAIELKDYGKRNDTRFHRFLIAHEIAHTFLYDTKSVPFVDYAFFPPGSREIEFLCNFLARTILLPKPLIQKKLSKIPSLHDANFSLIEVSRLCNSFKVQHNVLLNRLIFDTGLWDCLFLRFRNYSDHVQNWRLVERYLPSIYWNNKQAYIPPEDSKKEKSNPLRYPSAKGNLQNIFTSVYSNLKHVKRESKEYDANDLEFPPLKNFIKEYFHGKKATVHFSLAIDQQTQAEHLNVCIPLPR